MELVHKIEYRLLTLADLQAGLLDSFNRYQEIDKVWCDTDKEQRLIEDPFKEEWTKEFKDQLVLEGFQKCIVSGGCVIAAFYRDEVIAFAMLESSLFGSEDQYLQLSEFDVSFEYRGLGVGKQMFLYCAEEAKKRKAKKIYISFHAAKETAAFYQSMGCVPAQEPEEQMPDAVRMQLEYDIR